MRQHGEIILQRVISGIGGKLPRSNLGFLAELLLAFSRRMSSETKKWLKALFQEVDKIRIRGRRYRSQKLTCVACKDGFPSSRVSQEVKDRYAKTILRFA